MKRTNMINFALGVLIGSIGITTVFATTEIKSVSFSDATMILRNNPISMPDSLVSIVTEGNENAKIYAPIRDFSKELGYNVEWDGIEQTIHFTPRIISSELESDKFFREAMPLIAAVPEEDTYLYNLRPSGAVLTHQAVSKSFNWICLSPRNVLPQMKVFDYDGDGRKDIAVSLNNGSGTGVNIDELYIIQIIGDNLSGYPNPYDADLIDYQFTEKNIHEELKSKVTHSIYKKEGEILTDIQSAEDFIQINISDIHPEVTDIENVEFSFYLSDCTFALLDDGEIIMNTKASLISTNRATPYHIAEVIAQISFLEGNYKLSNIQFSSIGSF